MLLILVVLLVVDFLVEEGFEFGGGGFVGERGDGGLKKCSGGGEERGRGAQLGIQSCYCDAQ